jgi:hypothetical protein
VTTAVIVPLNSLLFAVVPAPAKLLVDVPAALARLNEFADSPGSAVTLAASLPALVDRARALLRRRDLLDDLDRDRVADEAGAVVLEQRPVLRRLVDRAVGDRRLDDRLGRCVDRRREVDRRARIELLAARERGEDGGADDGARERGGEALHAGCAHS